MADKIIHLAPPELGFYAKELIYEGIPIKAPEVVADEALFKVREWMTKELRHLPDATYNLKMAGAEFHIIGKDQQTSDLPEYRPGLALFRSHQSRTRRGGDADRTAPR